MLKAFLLSLACSTALAAIDLSNLPTNTDPLNITIPNIPQTTSYDLATECTFYTSNYTIDQTKWPLSWQTATSNNMNSSAEFTNLYNQIDWSKAPNAPVRKLGATGGLDLTGYDTVNDPYCWWSATQCTTPKTQGINADIRSCSEPETWGLVS